MIMVFYVRHMYFFSDLGFYISIFKDKATRDFIFDGVWKMLLFFSPWRHPYQYVCIAKKNEGERKVAVCHFSHLEGNKFEIAGGIPSKLQNSGIGIYSCIAFVNQFFQERPDAIIISCASANNVRSFRMVTSIGFKLIKQDDRHFETFLTREMFDNDFTNSVKLRIGL